MDLVIKQGFNLQKIKQINHSRLHLIAITFSDLADEVGIHIKSSCYDWSQASPINTVWKKVYNFPKPLDIILKDPSHMQRQKTKKAT